MRMSQPDQPTSPHLPAIVLAAGLSAHLADVQRRVPGGSLVLQVDEPLLPAVLAGRVPTASGFHRHRSVDAPAAAPALEEVLAVSGDPVVHCCAAEVPFDLLEKAGDPGIGVDLSVLTPGEYDALADERTGTDVVVPTNKPTNQHA